MYTLFVNGTYVIMAILIKSVVTTSGIASLTVMPGHKFSHNTAS